MEEIMELRIEVGIDRKTHYELQLRCLELLLREAEANEVALKMIKNHPNSGEYFSDRDREDIGKFLKRSVEIVSDVVEMHKESKIENIERMAESIKIISPQIAETHGFILGKASCLGKAIVFDEPIGEANKMLLCGVDDLRVRLGNFSVSLRKAPTREMPKEAFEKIEGNLALFLALIQNARRNPKGE